MSTPRKPFKHIIEKLFRIPNKRGEIVPFILNNVQQDLHERIIQHNFIDILKFRQAGVTSLIMAYFLIECMSRFCTAVMIAHDKDHTERLLERCRLFIDLLNGPKPTLSRLNEQEIFFGKTHSTFYIGTAGSKSFGRSATITHLHCSEYAYWKDPKTLIGGLFQAVPHETGIIIKESTANGHGTFHHRQYMKAVRGDSRFKAVFYPWYIFEEYSSSAPLAYPLTVEERELQQRFGLTEGQIQWRREKIDDFEGDVNIFKQEYPSTIEEAFLVSGGTMFSDVSYISNPEWKRVPSPFGFGTLEKLVGHPKSDLHYVFGIDVAGGTGRDYSVVEGLCVETGEQVLSFRTNTTAPPVFAQALIELGRQYNMAYLVPESNQHGLSVISILREQEPYSTCAHRIYKSAVRKSMLSPTQIVPVTYGFKTTTATKFSLIGTLQKTLPELTLHSEVTVEELKGFGETDLGTLGNVEGAHDDHVIALALACVGLLKERARGIVAHLNYNEEFVEKGKGKVVPFEDILKSLRSKKRKDWFGEHARTSNDSIIYF